MSTTISTRRLVGFLVGCMGVRVSFVILAATVPLPWLKVMAAFAAAIAVGFAVIFLGGFRPTGIETDGQPIWWNSLRPLHSILYALFAYFAWYGHRRPAWITLLVDVTIGLVSFLYNHRNSRIA